MTKRDIQAAEYRAEAAAKLPESDGFYWWRRYPSWSWEIVRVRRCEMTSKLIMNDWEVSLQKGEWGGRIQEPSPTPRQL